MTTNEAVLMYTERGYAGSSIKIISWVDTHEQMISINVMVGQHRSDLSRTFAIADVEAARTHYAFVQNGARAGRTEAALIADLQRAPIEPVWRPKPAPMFSVALMRQRHGRRARLTGAQEDAVSLARMPGRNGRIGVEDVDSWLTLRALVDKRWAEVLEREDGRAAGRILSVRVYDRDAA